MGRSSVRLAGLSVVLVVTACAAEDVGAPSTLPASSPAAEDAPSPSAPGEVPSAESAPDPVDAGLPPLPTTPDPEIDTIPWEEGGDVGFGVARRDTQNSSGENAAIFYAGYQASLAGAKGWATQFYKQELQSRGVRYLYAVQGPNTIPYSNFEIGNTSVVASLLSKISDKTKFIAVLGHSSGSFVAHEFLGQIAGPFDSEKKTKGKVVYFDLDGGRSGFDGNTVCLRKAYFLSPRDSKTGTGGFNNGTMEALGADYAGLGGLVAYDASVAGCNSGATGCIHVSLVIDKPHSAAGATPGKDYDDFSGGRKATTSFFVAKATEAGLVR